VTIQIISAIALVTAIRNPQLMDIHHSSSHILATIHFRKNVTVVIR